MIEILFGILIVLGMGVLLITYFLKEIALGLLRIHQLLKDKSGTITSVNNSFESVLRDPAGRQVVIVPENVHAPGFPGLDGIRYLHQWDYDREWIHHNAKEIGQ